MSGTFSSLNTALSALRYNRVAMDTASGNVANVGTDGYARRRVNAESVGAPSAPAMWSRYQGSGDGVRVASLDRMVDPFLDVRARREHANQSYLDVRETVLTRIEAGIGEPGDNGVSAALSEFLQSFHDLANNPGSEASRAQVLARASTLADAVRLQARQAGDEASDQRFHLLETVAEVNTVASDLAASNKSIAVATLNGTDANTLLDQRDQLALRLADLVGARATQRPDGGLDVTVNGVPLVTGQVAGQLVVASGVTPTGDADGSPVTFTVVDTSGTTPVPAGARGEVGGVTDLLTTTLPAYLSGLDAVAQQLADEINAQHTAGFDRNGAAGVAMFTYDPTNVAATLAVGFTDPARVAASSLPGGVLDESNATALAAATTAGEAYQRLVNGFGSEVSSVRRLAANQSALTDQVDGAREQLSGVNIDEEMVAMVAAQRAFEAASRVMSTLDSVLDTLINRTGLVR